MKQLNVIVCDDEIVHRKIIIQYLEEYRCDRMNTPIIYYECGCAEEALRLVNDSPTRYDIVFLDVMLEGMDGNEAARQIKKLYNDAVVMLMSSNYDNEETGYELEIFQFVRKPVDREKVFRYMDRALLKIDWSLCTVKVKDMKAGYRLLQADDILFVTIVQRYIAIHTEHNDVIFTRGKIEDWKETLSYRQFYSPHKSYIICLDKVVKVQDLNVYFTNGEVIHLAKKMFMQMQKVYEKYVWEGMRDERLMVYC